MIAVVLLVLAALLAIAIMQLVFKAIKWALIICLCLSIGYCAYSKGSVNHARSIHNDKHGN